MMHKMIRRVPLKISVALVALVFILYFVWNMANINKHTHSDTLGFNLYRNLPDIGQSTFVSRTQYTIISSDSQHLFEISSALVQNFSKLLFHNVTAMFFKDQNWLAVDPFYIMSSALLPQGDKEIVGVFRVWFNYESLLGPSYLFREGINQYEDNYLYTAKFNHLLQPLSAGHLIGIPVPKQYVMAGGPGDPRLIQVGVNMYLSFYMSLYLDSLNVGHMFLWNLKSNTLIKPEIPSYRLNTIDSNWAPFSSNGCLHYVYTFDPLRILRCCKLPVCSFHWSQDNVKSNFPFHPVKSVLRGGTQFIPYWKNYFLGLAHSKVSETNERSTSIYGAHFVLFATRPYRIVLLSGPILLKPSVTQDIPIIRRKVIERSFWFPLSIFLLDKDTCIVGAHINDHSGYAIRLSGFQTMLTEAITADLKEYSKVTDIRHAPPFAKIGYVNDLAVQFF